MKSLSKKVLLTTTAVSLAVAVGSVAYAGTALKKITAYQNTALSIKVDGKTVSLYDSGENLYPITYNNRTYIPAAPVVKAMGGSAGFNAASNSVDISTVAKPNTGGDATVASDGTNLAQNYTANSAASKIFADNKAAAAYGIRLFAAALQNGDTAAVKAWMRKNIKKSENGNDRYVDNAADLDDQISYLRKNYTDAELGPIANDAINKAKSQTFNGDSSFEDYTYSKYVTYYVSAESDDYSRRFGVYITYSLNDDTNKFYVSSITFY
ncbi:hypothetical protein PaecuDRAFT_1463 [Paenibacillus curdlanolyticus YK9]|uniref:Copper amine oxidase-like N-terminal domain-containing protein n=1 Tax=Paenibacillus curdlanolyticus YK9 TaxID=717606 RepID=E0I739_9BACL|nr:hypothetical protein [Paenibacillus curdlanolyticus]EFM11855.1 hypothetical protein PaecuDRAFT_1463 [Paenibacillus curdlanolyticus YK9]